jgi:hypothetical protein
MENRLKIHKYIFRFDTILNWVIGLGLVVLNVDALLMENPPVIQGWFYRVLGIIYLGFAAWQTYNAKNTSAPATLRFAFWMVVIPVLFMGWALIAFHSDLKPIIRILLWIAEFYMVLLSGWYGYLYQTQQPINL